MIVVNSIENNISRFQLSFNSQSTTFLLAWPVSPFPWRSRQEPTGADRSRQEPTGFLLAWPVSPFKLLPCAWLPARPRLGPVTRARAGLGAGSRPGLQQCSPASTAGSMVSAESNIKRMITYFKLSVFTFFYFSSYSQPSLKLILI